MDFFAGSTSTAHAVMHLNANNKANRKFIMVQLPENANEDSEAFKAGYKTVSEIGLERIRVVGKMMKSEVLGKSLEISFAGEKTASDTGVRVFRLDESNMKDVYYKPHEYSQQNLDLFANNIKPDRSADDLVFQIMLDWGLPLSLNIERIIILGKEVIQVAGNSLFACFASGIDEAFAKEIAVLKPLRIVFQDKSFEDDTSKENVRQLFKQLSPATEMRVL